MHDLLCTVFLNMSKQSELLVVEARLDLVKKLSAQLLKELDFMDMVSERVDDILKNGTSEGLVEEVTNFEREMIRYALHQTKGNQRQAAVLLGIKATTMHEKVKRLSIGPADLFVAQQRET